MAAPRRTTSSASGPSNTGRDRVRSFRRGELLFDVADEGPIDGLVAVLLHGWPGGGETWRGLAPRLHAQGIRTLIPDQRGYSPGARPVGIKPYVMQELVADVVALIDEAGIDRVHVVGHDWGGAVAWALASNSPQRVATLTVLSTPHPGALTSSLLRSDQILRSSYIFGFQVPLLAEKVLLARDAALLRTALERSGLDPETTGEYVRRQQEPGALSASLAWYRAVPFSGGGGAGTIEVPTTYIWSTGDTALGRKAAESTADHVTGPYRFEVLEGVSHWIPETRPDRAADLIASRVFEPEQGSRQ